MVRAKPHPLRDSLLGGRVSLELLARARDQARAGCGETRREQEAAEGRRAALVYPNEAGLLTMIATPRCEYCDGVIAVCAPMIVVANGRARRSSRAAQQEAGGGAGECYHLACYTAVARSAGWSVRRAQRA
jgi:hypothetical protein